MFTMGSKPALRTALCAVFLVTVTSFDLTIMHTNHIQAHIEEFTADGLTCSEQDSVYLECYGGVSRRYTRVQEIRDEHVNPLLLDGGDYFQGTQWYTYYRGNATAHFMNWIQYDAMAPSNHEFDDGPENFGAFLEKVDFPVISCNMDASNVPEMQGLYTKSIVVDMDGERVGIVGYTTTDTYLISAPGDLVISDEIEALQNEVDLLTNDGINKIIVLGTSGLQKETEIALNVDNVDVIVGADHHQFLYTGDPPTDDVVTSPYPTVIRPTPDDIVLIVQTSDYGQYLGLLEISFDDEGRITDYSGNPILLDSSIEEDPETLAEVQKWAEPIRTWGDRNVGNTYAHLDGEKADCRSMECNMGNLLTDAFLSEHITFQDEDGWSDVSIAVLNSGAIRASIPAGEISLDDITTVMPFENTIDVLELRGHHVLEMLEHSVEEYDLVLLRGFFLQYAGLKVTYDLTKPVGNRVTSALVRCSMCAIPVYEPLNVEQVYKVVMQSYLAEGGDGFTMIPEHMISRTMGRRDWEVIAEYLSKHSPIITGIEGRITVLGETSSANLLRPSIVVTILISIFVCLDIK